MEYVETWLTAVGAELFTPTRGERKLRSLSGTVEIESFPRIAISAGDVVFRGAGASSRCEGDTGRARQD
jgi:hypothetical protein